MPIDVQDLKNDTILKYASVTGPLIMYPASDDDSIAAAQSPTLGTAITLNGAGVLNVTGSTTAAYMPRPLAPVFVCNDKADTFVALITGLNQFGRATSDTVTKAQVVTATQRGVNGVCFSRIDSIVFSAYTSAGNVTVGNRFAGNDPGGIAETGQNSAMRIPLMVPLPNIADLIGAYIMDAGGGTFAAAAGVGAMLKSGVATFTAGGISSSPPGSFFSYVSACTAQPTRPVIFMPMYKPGVAGVRNGI